MKSSNKEFLLHYNQYKDKIYNYFFYRLNFNRAKAEDQTSEVFIKAFAKFESFDADRSFQAWIYAIAKNHLANYYRSACREVELQQAENLSVDHKAKIEACLELEDIIEKIKLLDSYCQEVLLLKFVDGFSNKEIAEVLSREEGAIRTQISRALVILRSKLN